MAVTQRNVHVPNLALADALKDFVPLRKAEEGGDETPQAEKQTAEPNPQSASPAVDVVDIDALMAGGAVHKVKKVESGIPPAKTQKATIRVTMKKVPRDQNLETPRVASQLPKGNVSVWKLFDRNPNKLVQHIQGLLEKKEKPYFTITMVEHDTVTMLCLAVSLVGPSKSVKFVVTEGAGRLIEAFPTGTTFYAGELTGESISADVHQQKIAVAFMVEVHALMHQLFITERKKANASQVGN